MSRPNGKSRNLLYGEQEIAAAELEAVPNPAPQRDYLIACASPEFTCLCPRSGFPDFATIRLRYVPDRSIVELKSLKLYLNRYRDEHAFHEAVVNQIADDIAAAIDPRYERAAQIARYYVYGIPSQKDEASETGWWMGQLVNQGNDWECYAGLASAVMGDISRLPPYVRRFYVDLFDEPAER